jgi:phospholipid/cholesterol/gamma-HCH transport system substrate-binding protein
MEQHADKLGRVAENVEKMSDEGLQAVVSARKKYVENPAIDRIIANLDRTVAVGARDLPPLLAHGKTVLAGASKLTNTLSSDKNLARINSMLIDLEATTRSAKLATADAQHVAAHIRRGRGSMGAIVMDEQLFDDLQELARDLKHNPWKLFWRE